MDKPVFENGFRNDAQARCHRHQHHELGLHIGRKSGIGQGFDIDAGYQLRAFHPDGLSRHQILAPASSQFMNQGLQMVGFTVLKGDIPSGQGGGHHERSGLDPVRNDGSRYRAKGRQRP